MGQTAGGLWSGMGLFDRPGGRFLSWFDKYSSGAGLRSG